MSVAVTGVPDAANVVPDAAAEMRADDGSPERDGDATTGRSDTETDDSTESSDYLNESDELQAVDDAVNDARGTIEVTGAAEDDQADGGSPAALSAVTAALSGTAHDKRIRWLSELRSNLNSQFVNEGAARPVLEVDVEDHKEVIAQRLRGVSGFGGFDSLNMLRNMVRGVTDEELAAVMVLYEVLREQNKVCTLVLDCVHAVTLGGILLSALDPPNPGRWRHRALTAFCCGEAGTSKTATLMSMLRPLVRKVVEVNVQHRGGENALKEVHKLLTYPISVFDDGGYLGDGQDEGNTVANAVFKLLPGTLKPILILCFFVCVLPSSCKSVPSRCSLPPIDNLTATPLRSLSFYFLRLLCCLSSPSCLDMSVDRACDEEEDPEAGREGDGRFHGPRAREVRPRDHPVRGAGPLAIGGEEAEQGDPRGGPERHRPRRTREGSAPPGGQLWFHGHVGRA